jgi:TonB family protein
MRALPLITLLLLAAGADSHAQGGEQPTFPVEEFSSMTDCEFGTMKSPTRLQGADPRYTKEALAARIEGLVIVKCRITLKGEVKNCLVVKPLPPLDTVFVQALEASRYTPVEYKGKPVEVNHTFFYRFKLPPSASAPRPDPAKR